MKLKLNKKKIKNLSKDTKAIPVELTPQVAGGYMDAPRTMFCGQTDNNCWIFV